MGGVNKELLQALNVNSIIRIIMKKILLLFTVFCFASSGYGQQDEISFGYDNAGNQISRQFIVLKTKQPTPQVNEEAVAEIPEDEKSTRNVLNYYPNPVDSELTLDWGQSINARIQAISVYTIDGKLLRQISPNTGMSKFTIPFNSYDRGVFLVAATFEGGHVESFKIIKK